MVSGEVKAILDMLAEKFGTTVEMLWGILIKQAYVEGFRHGAFGMVILIAAIVILIVCYRIYNKSIEVDRDDIGTRFIGWAIALISFFFIIHNFNMMIGYLANPEYYALEMILNLLQ